MISSIRKSLNSIPSTQKNTGFEKISLEQEKNYKGQLKVMNSYTGSDKVMNSYSGSEKIININNTEPATKNHNNSGIKKNKHDIVELLNLLDKCTQILKDDRTLLRKKLKEGDGILEELLFKYKKKTDISQLQQELRKMLKNKTKQILPNNNILTTKDQNSKLLLSKNIIKDNLYSIPGQKSPKFGGSEEIIINYNKELEELSDLEKKRDGKKHQSLEELMNLEIPSSDEEGIKMLLCNENFEKKINCENIPEVNLSKEMDETNREYLSTIRNENTVENQLEEIQEIQNGIEEFQKNEIYEKQELKEEEIQEYKEEIQEFKEEIQENEQNKDEIEINFENTQNQQLSNEEEIIIENSGTNQQLKNYENNNNNNNTNTNNFSEQEKIFEMYECSQEYIKPIDIMVSERTLETEENKIFIPEKIYYKSVEIEKTKTFADFIHRKSYESKAKGRPWELEEDERDKYVDNLFFTYRFARKNEGKNLINKKLRPDLDRDFVWKIQKEAGFENISPEIIMNEVFDDQKLAKISRTFFRIKMVNLIKKLKKNEKNDKIFNELFNLTDLKKDGFLDVNELGFSLDVICFRKDFGNPIRKMFDLLDKYFRNYLNLFEIEEIFQGEENGERIIILFKDLYKEIDVEFNNNLTYWEAYRSKNDPKLIEILNILGLNE